MDVQKTSKEKNKEKRFWKETRILIKKIRHSKLPITLESADHLTQDMLKAIQIQMAEYSWDDWIDEDGKWFKYWNKPNPKQIQLFN